MVELTQDLAFADESSHGLFIGWTDSALEVLHRHDGVSLSIQRAVNARGRTLRYEFEPLVAAVIFRRVSFYLWWLRSRVCGDGGDDQHAISAPVKMSSADFGKLMMSETVKWTEVIKAAGIKGE